MKYTLLSRQKKIQLNPLPDNAVMVQVQNGQTDAICILFERYKKILYSFFAHMTQDRFLAEDLVQNVFIRVMRYNKQYKGEGSFKAWLFTIARNVMADHYRRGAKMRTEMIDSSTHELHGESNPYEEILEDERKNFLHKAISRLDEDKREVLILVKLHEMKYKDVAQMLRMNESTVKVKVFRAMKELQKILQTSKQSL